MRIPVTIASLLGVVLASHGLLATSLNSGFSWVAVSFAAGLLAATWWVTRDDRARRPLLPIAPMSVCLLLSASSTISWWFVSVGSGVPRTLALASVAASGFVLAYVVFHAGVQKTTRVCMISAVLTGMVATVGLAGLDGFGGTKLAIVGFLSPVLLLGLAMMPAVRATDMAAPIPEPWLAGPLTLVGSVLLGSGATVIVPAVLVGDTAWRIAYAGAFLVAVWLGPARASRARRAGVQIGSATLWGVGLLAAFAFAGGFSEGVQETRLGRGSVLVALACFGFALPFLARLYAQVPLGSNVLSEIPDRELRAPVGAVLRLVAACVGVAIAASGGFSLSVDRGLWLLFVAGILLVGFDPRAGSGRKSITLLFAAAPALGAMLWATGLLPS